MDRQTPQTPVTERPDQRFLVRLPVTLFFLAILVMLLDGCSCAPLADFPSGPPVQPEAVGPVAMFFPVAPTKSIERNDDQDLVPIANAPLALEDPTTDLWERIRRGFGIPNLESKQVHEAVQWYASRPEYIQRMTVRSQRYLFHIVEELERRNMPTELALLPFVESAFNPQALSSARAAGMWQFIPSTGKNFALKQNLFRDDRRDVRASTRAALDYLQKLHSMFGDWHLALAAYNWGEGNVSRAITRNQRSGLGVGYTDLKMPAETQGYVPKLQAIKNIVANPQAFGVGLPQIHNHPYFQSVTIKRDIDATLAARLAEISHDDFKALNPSANRPVILASGTPQILLPWNSVDVFQRNLSATGGRQLASWTAWAVPTTMNPATAAKRVGMTEAELRNANSVPPGKSIKAGSTLLIRRKPTQQADVSGSVADMAQLVLVKTKQTARTKKRKTTGKTVMMPTRTASKRQSGSIT